MAGSGRKQLQEAIDKIEGAYEFFLAYAAQGLTRESDASRVVRQFSEHLNAMVDGVSVLGAALGRLVEEERPEAGDQLGAFKELLETDAARARVAMQVVKAQVFPTSQLVDNLNASVHVRALLTDLFLLDEALRLGVDGATKPGPSKSLS